MLFAKTPTKEFTPPPFLVFVVLVAAVIGSFEIYDRNRTILQPEPIIQIATTTVKEISDWKTYRNEEYGFEFKYPSTMVLSHDEYGDYFDSSVKDDNLERPVPLFWNIGKTKFKNVDEWLQERYKGRGELMPIKTSITVDGHSAYSIDDPLSIGAPITGIVFIKEGMLYDFTFSLNGADLIDEILSTFKFISTSTDSRILLTYENIPKYARYGDPQGSAVMEEDFNYDLPNQFVNYYNKNYGLSLEIPYNQNWGSVKYRIGPFDIRNDSISFGYISSFESSWTRDYRLEFLPVKNADQIIKEIEADDIVGYPAPIQKNIGNVSVVEYQSGEFCSYASIIVLGKKYNYGLRSLCSDDFKRLEEIVKTIKLVE